MSISSDRIALNEEQLSQVSGGYSGKTTVIITRKGDTWASLAAHYGTTVSELRNMNRAIDKNILDQGMRVTVPFIL